MRALVGSILLAWASFCSVASAQEKQLYMLDFVFMAEDHGLSERDTYNQAAQQAAANHGIALHVTLDKEIMMLGPPELDRLDIWTFPDTAALGAWANDPEYKEIEPVAKKIHDWNQLSLYLAREVQAPTLKPKGRYYVELLTFNKDEFVGKEFVAYVRQSDAIAKEYGLLRVASFGSGKKILGNGPPANWMNIYEVSSLDKMKAWPNDKRFSALIPTREKLFVVDSLLMGIFRASAE